MGILEQSERQQMSRNLQSYIYFVIQGIISLLGYNAILGSLDYFAENFDEYNIYFYLPLPPMITFNLVSLIMPYIAQRISYPLRISISIIGMLVILVLLPIATNYLSQTSLGFVAIMILSLIWGVFGQVFNSSLIGLSCMIDRNQVVAYNIGSSASGIIIIILRMIATSALDDDINISTLIYFLSAGFINVVGFIIHLFYVKSQSYKIFRKKNQQSLIYQQEEVIFLNNRQNSNGQIIQDDDQTVFHTPDTINQVHSENKNGIQLSENEENRGKSQSIESLKMHSNIQDKLLENRESMNFDEMTFLQQFKQYLSVSQNLMPLPFFMLLSNVCANMMYPAVSLKSSLSGMSYTWSCIWIVFMHNISNVMGKYLTAIRVLYNATIINVLVVLRFLHFIIFIMNASNPDSIFSADWIICLNIILFSFSAGYTDGALFILASEKMMTNIHREQGGFIMAFSLTFGIMVGIFLAMPFQNI